MAITGYDPNKLYAQLLNTGLQQKDPSLYQVIYLLIGQLANLSPGGSGGGGGSSTINNITNIIQQLGGVAFDGLDGQDGLTIPGSGSSSFNQNTGYWTPLTDGDVDETDLIFANGDAIAVFVPTP